MRSVVVNVSLILLCSISTHAQSTYNNCFQALDLCPNVPVQVNNLGATILQTMAGTGQDNISFCFTPNNTIWLRFETNSTGGMTQIDVTNPVFQTNVGQDNEIQAAVIDAGSPCDGSTYSSIASGCVTNATAGFTMNVNLAANSTFYLVLNGAKNGPGITQAAEFTADVTLSGVGVNRPNPTLSIQSGVSFCQDELVTFVASLDNCPDSSSYQWFINGTLVAVTIDSVFQTTALQNGDVVTVTNSCFIQCPVTPSASTPAITVISFPVDAGPDAQIKPDESVTLQGSTTAPLYYWTPTSNISNTGILNPVVSPQVTTSYFLTGEANGCKISDEVVITVDLKLEIVNSFSPNDDHVNDTWEIPGLILFPNCLVQIYDRWGQLMYSATGYNEKKAWDGKHNGQRVNESVYFYSIDLRESGYKVLKGSVTIIR